MPATPTHPESLVARAQRLDAEIARAGGLAAYWTREQERRRAAGEPHYERLVEPATGRVIAEVGS